MERIHPLRAYRDRQTPPLTQGQLAVLLGVSKASVSRWEAGTRKVDRELIPRVSEATSISPAELRPDFADLMRSPEA